MSIVDFKEIPEAHLATGDQDIFELFARDFLEALGFEIIEGPGRGIDRGRDLIITEIIGGTISRQEKRWVVSAKHNAHSGKSVTDQDERDPIGRVRKFQAQGFMGFYSTVPSSGLDDTLTRIRSEIDVYVFDRGRIEKKLLSHPELQTIFQQYFPSSYTHFIASTSSKLKTSDLHLEVSELLGKVQSNSVPLSQCMVEALALAQKANNSSLEKFCENELSGWYDADYVGDTDEASHRLIEIYLALGVEINLDAGIWNQNSGRVIDYARQHPQEFHPCKLMMGLPVAELEAKQKTDMSTALVTFNLRLGGIFPDSQFENPDLPVKGYAHPGIFQTIFDSVRRELTIHLLNMLPKVDSEKLIS